MLPLLIYTHEGRDVGTVDVVGAYLLANIADSVLAKLICNVVDIMCKVNKTYLPFVSMENVVKVLYMRLTKYYMAVCS